MQMPTWKLVFLLLQLLVFQNQIKLKSSADNQLTNLGSNLMQVNVPYIGDSDVSV